MLQLAAEPTELLTPDNDNGRPLSCGALTMLRRRPIISRHRRCRCCDVMAINKLYLQPARSMADEFRYFFR